MSVGLLKIRVRTLAALALLMLGLGSYAGTAAMAQSDGQADDQNDRQKNGDTPGWRGDSARGRLLYERYSCYACHGYTGETGSGARLNPPRFAPAAFIAYVRNPSGRMIGTGAGASMPAYAATGLTDQDLADIHAWLQSMPSFSPPLEEIPLLQR